MRSVQMKRKNPNYHTVTSYIFVPDASAINAEVRIGDSIVMVGEPPEGIDVYPASIYLSVED